MNKHAQTIEPTQRSAGQRTQRMKVTMLQMHADDAAAKGCQS